ncbi:hypothetical protein HDU83_002257 [Entophlyctis luteolus]|nr:hypothetical protein HDU82_008671 [Entophlyctis luteolus]KAJ3355972.1 hypothetical protein HDU83_002257 [Entophlyctis luteolus]
METTYTTNLGDAISASLTRIIYELDMKVVAAKLSQDELARELDRLDEELRVFLDSPDSQPPSLKLDSLAQQMLAGRKKLATACTLIKLSLDRIGRIERMLGVSSKINR